MEVPNNLFYWLLTTVPILSLVLLMGILKKGATKAAFLTLLVSIILSLLVFQANIPMIGMELLKAVWSSASIISVVITALFLYEVSREAHAYDVLYQLAHELAPNELIRILLVGVGFSSFLQGFAGFGVPVLVTAPLLLRMGVSPIWAVVIPLLGHSWAGTFGTFALAWSAMLEQVGDVDLIATAAFAALFLGMFSAAANVWITYAYGKWAALKKGLPAILLLTLIQGGGQLLLAGGHPELAAFLPSALSVAALIGLSRMPSYDHEWQIANSRVKDRRHVESNKTEQKLQIFPWLFPYFIISLFAFPALLFQPLSDWLGQLSFGLPTVETRTGLGFVNPSLIQYAPLVFFKHPSFFLFLSAWFSFWYYRKKGLISREKKLRTVLKNTALRSLYPCLAILALVGVARVMTGTGQTYILASGIANFFGKRYVFIAPSVGMLGSFLTGGNMTSNILFGNFQYMTAEMLNLHSAAILGAQTAGGAMGMAIAPSVIVVATATIGLSGKEGRIILKLFPIILFLSVLMGILLFIFHAF